MFARAATRRVVVLATLGCLFGSCYRAFVASGTQLPTHSVTSRPGASPSPGGLYSDATFSKAVPGVACGAAFSMGVLVAVSAAVQVAGARQRSRVIARIGNSSPSLIQVLEQKGLLSTAEKLKLLSTAENFGVELQTVEELGLLKFAEDNSLLSLAENTLTDPGTVAKAATFGVVLAGIAAYLVTSEPDFISSILIGAFGAPALVLFGAAVVIAGITGGTRRTGDLNCERKRVQYVPSVDPNITKNMPGGTGFKETVTNEPVTLLNVVEEKKLLTFVEEYRLLSLAAWAAKLLKINKPLTLTEQTGVLSTLEKSRILSYVEGTAVDKLGAARYLLGGGAFFVAALVLSTAVGGGVLGTLLAILVSLPGLALIAVGLALGVIQVPATFTR